MSPTPTAARIDHVLDDNPSTFLPLRRAQVIAAAAGVIGGLALFCDLALHAFGPLDRSHLIVAALMALCLLGVPAGLLLRGAISTGWCRGLGLVGTGVVVLGAATWVTAFAILYADPGAGVTDRLAPAGSALMAFGMILLGVAVIGSRRVTGMSAVAPLAVGVYFPAQLVIQVNFFLDGRDAEPGPNSALLGAWGLFWVWAALISPNAKRRNRC